MAGHTADETPVVRGEVLAGQIQECMHGLLIEGTQPYTRESLRSTFSGLLDADVRKMLSENAAGVYGFDLEALQPVADQVGPSPDDLATPFERKDKPRDYIGSGFRI